MILEYRNKDLKKELIKHWIILLKKHFSKTINDKTFIRLCNNDIYAIIINKFDNF